MIYHKDTKTRRFVYIGILLCLSAFVVKLYAASAVINAFNSGEVSPLLEGRTDIEKHYSSLRTCENLLAEPWGDVTKRPGTYYIEAVAERKLWHPGTPELISDYPTLRAATEQADPGLPHEIPISDISTLQEIEHTVDANGLVSGHYYLTNDIDASETSTWNGGAGFIPICRNYPETHWGGTLDGCGYKITNLYQDATLRTHPVASDHQLGLFGWLEGNGAGTSKVANLTIENVTFIGASGGVLANQIGSKSEVYNVHVSGTITIKKDNTIGATVDGIGGMAGNTGLSSVNAGTFYDCTTDVNIVTDGVSVLTTFQKIGGFVGKILGKTLIYNCKTYGEIDTTGLSKTSSYVGGFIGYSPSTYTITVQDCNAFGDVSGGSYVGGFFGYNQKSIQRCFAGGNVTGTGNYIGGFTGYGSIGNYTDCYAWGDVAGGTYVGGFNGYSISGSYSQVYSIGAVTGTTTGGLVAYKATGSGYNSYWDTDTSGQATSAIGEGKTTAWLKTKTNYPSAWDFETIWYMEDYVPPTEGYWETISGPTDPVRLIDCVVSTERAFVIEMGDKYFRFLK